jgi:hypothetical protein
MEIGMGAGKSDNENKSTSLISDAKKDDMESWRIHVPDDFNVSEPSSDHFHMYAKWQMGGQKYYFPGTPNSAGNGLTATSSNDTGVIARQTPNAKVISMVEWHNLGNVIDDYWVMDSDGWAYWTKPLLPNESTGILLANIFLDADANDDYYYSVYVASQIATPEGNAHYNNFEKIGGWTDSGKSLLETLFLSTTTLTDISITSDRMVKDGIIYANPGEFVTLTAFGSNGSSEIDWMYAERPTFSVSINENIATAAIFSDTRNEEIILTAFYKPDTSIRKAITIVIGGKQNRRTTNEQLAISNE